jgi:hypothetical protein
MELRTTTEIFEALGGTKAVALITGRKYSAAYNWRKAGRFPANTFLKLKIALREKGHTAPASLWGM